MNILHLSDIHFGRNYVCHITNEPFEKKECILNELIECIGNMDVKDRPEHILVTGDIAWFGKKAEFAEAEIWFNRLLIACGLKGKDITFCPGNHDVNWSYMSGCSGLQCDDIKNIDDIYSYQNIHRLEPPIYEYDYFCESIGMEPYKYPLDGNWEYSYSVGYKDIKFSSGKVVRIYSFNTALLSAISSIPEDKMWIGQPQIYELMKYQLLPANKDIHYSIALFHHAERFLHKNELSEYDGRKATLPLLQDNVDLILCGHTETGGRPVLKIQAGGGKLLTAGATYFNDEHPNAFSIISISEMDKEMTFQQYSYNKGWKKYQSTKDEITTECIHEMPSMGDIQQECIFEIKNGNEIYSLLLKRLELFPYEVNGEKYIRMNNRKEVLRALDFSYDSSVIGGNVNFNAELAPKMEKNVESMLKREEFFNYLATCMDKERTSFCIKDATGRVFASGSGLKADIKKDDFSEEIMRKLLKIEKYFDIKFYRPDDIYERELDRINSLIELIEQGYLVDFYPFKGEISIPVSSLDALKNIYEIACVENKFAFAYDRRFGCSIYEASFEIGEAVLLLIDFKVKIDDLKNKVNSFCEGDIRKIVFEPTETTKNLFILKRDDRKIELPYDINCEIFSLPPTDLSKYFIYEIREEMNQK